VAAIDNLAQMGGFAASLLLGFFLQPEPQRRPQQDAPPDRDESGGATNRIHRHRRPG